MNTVMRLAAEVWLLRESGSWSDKRRKARPSLSAEV